MRVQLGRSIYYQNYYQANFRQLLKIMMLRQKLQKKRRNFCIDVKEDTFKQ